MTCETLLKRHYQIVRERWLFGIRRFYELINSRPFREKVKAVKKELKKARNADEKDVKVFKSAIYGDIQVPMPERELFDSFFLQRLKYISHLGLAYHVYPEARHSRFEHSLGTYFLSKIICRNLETDNVTNEVPEGRMKALIFAALLHDIGHGPFSHLTDLVFKGFKKVRRDKRKFMTEKEYPKYHEKRARDMILDEDEILIQTLGLKDIKLGIKDLLEMLDLDYRFIAFSITGEDRDSQGLSFLINGPLDVDKQDYLYRDSYYTGVPYGVIDYDRISRMFKFSKNGILGIKEKSFRLMIHMLFSREFSYQAIIFHHVSRVLTAMLYVAVELAMELMSRVQQDEFLRHLELMDDSDLLYALELIGKFWDKEKSNATQGLIKKIVRGIKTRTLYKRAAEYKFIDFTDSDEFGLVYDFRKKLEYFTSADLKTLPKKSRVRLMPLIKRLEDQGELIILDMSGIDDIEDARKLLSTISVVANDERTISMEKYIREHFGGSKLEAHKKYCTTGTDYVSILNRMRVDSSIVYIFASDAVRKKFGEVLKDKQILLKLLEMSLVRI